MSYEVTLTGGEVDVVDGATTFRQDGQLLTFYRTRPGRDAIDCWSTPVASFRTATVSKVRLLEAV